MHDPEKSDSGIVATKPTNKAGVPVAELVEPRPGTKGNADQQNTHRTQSRARVAQALDRVRKAARQRKKEQFTFSSTTSTSTRSGRRTTRSSAKPRPAWMA
jgi:RNA-directed DNA polymerase